MTTGTKEAVAAETLAELMEQIGDVPLERVRLRPPLGMATEQDVLAARAGPGRRLCELVDGVLVEKVMATQESLLAGVILRFLGNFVDPDDLGVVLGADGMLRLMPGLVRIPDVSFTFWDRVPGEEVPADVIAEFSPDLAVEVLSRNNTKREVERKLRDYFLTGTQLVWVIQPKTQTAQIYTSATEFRRVGKTGALEGGDVLPGFRLPLGDLFARTARRKKRA
jgi:Uma2 family endonuclease